MKRLTIYPLLVLLVCLTTACKQKDRTTDGLTDTEKLEALDFRIEKNHKDASLLAERSEVLMRLGRVNEALTDISEAVRLKPNNLDYRLSQADIYFATGDVENSYKALSAAEKIAPDNNEVQLKMGEVTFYSSDYDRSLRCLSRVTERDPNNRTALFMKGFIYKMKGDTANAVGLLRKVCDIYPDYAPAFEELGVLYATHHSPMAVEYLTTAINLQPNNTNAMYALAMFYQDQEQMDEAETLYRQMLDINENSTDALHNLGYIEMMHYGDYERAIGYLTRAIETDPTCIAAFVNRGLAYEQTGNRTAARADYEEALRLDSGYEAAINGLNRLK